MGRKERNVVDLQAVYENLYYEIQVLKNIIETHQAAENQSNNYVGMQIAALNKDLEVNLKVEVIF